MQYNIHEAKTNFSRLVAEAASGKEVIVAKAGKPLVRVVPYRTPQKDDRIPGLDTGLVQVGPDFDDPLPEDLAEAFGG